MLRPLGSEEGPSTGPSTGPSIGPSTGPSRRRPGGFEEKVKGRKRWLHPLGECIITLYTNGKLRTRVMSRLPQKRLLAGGTEACNIVAGCCHGCIKVAGFTRLRGYYKGCQATAKAARLLRRLSGYCDGCQATAKASKPTVDDGKD
ncbi:hypothetical protein Tco_0196662 [Tanacetum coccineum]